MNMRDSEIILGLMQQHGYKQTKRLEEADIVLFNTCSVRRHAEERVWSQLGILKKKPIRTTKIIGILGCMAQNYQDGIFRRLPHVDLVCGPSNIYDIPQAIEKVFQENTRVLAVNRKSRPLISDCGFRINRLKAFVSIMYGCNNFCSYCIVPYVRGREVSRPLKHILDEVKDLAGRGCKEVTLLGQNVNSYGKDLRTKVNFVKLLEALDKIKGIARIRFVTSHPKDATKKMFGAMRDLPKVCEHLHLPLQAGSDKILRAMKRGYILKDYLKLIEYFRRIVPNGSLTTDIIAGFPGEAQTDFRKTYQAMQEIQFDEAFIFKYSPRPKTKAARLDDNVATEEKQDRNQSLLKLQEEISLRKNRKLLRRSLEVMAEERSDCFARGLRKNMFKGRTRTNKITLFSGTSDLVSKIVNVRINQATTHSLIGESDGKKN